MKAELSGRTLSSGRSCTDGIAVDSSGNLFDSTPTSVIELSPTVPLEASTHLGVTTTTCTVTYTYSPPASARMAKDGRAEALATIRGKRTVVATGRIRDRKLRPTFRHLMRGRYQLTLLALRAQDVALVIGHTTLAIS